LVAAAVVGLHWVARPTTPLGCSLEKTGHTIMKLRIETTGVTFLCTRIPEQRTNFDAGAPRIDKATGQALWLVQLIALDATGGEVLAVTVVGEPKVTVGQPVAVSGLVALPWSQDGRSGIAYRAETIAAGDSGAATAKAGPQAR
jgi:hypothetical protein